MSAFSSPFDVVAARRAQLAQTAVDPTAIPDTPDFNTERASADTQGELNVDATAMGQQQEQIDAAKAAAAQAKIDQANAAAQAKADAENAKANGVITQAQAVPGPSGAPIIQQVPQTNPDNTVAYQRKDFGIQSVNGDPYSVARNQWGADIYSDPYDAATAKLALNKSGAVMAQPLGKGASALPPKDVTMQGVSISDPSTTQGPGIKSDISVAPDSALNNPSIQGAIDQREQQVVAQGAKEAIADGPGADADDAQSALATARADHEASITKLGAARDAAKAALGTDGYDKAQAQLNQAQSDAVDKANALSAAAKAAAAAQDTARQAKADPIGFLQKKNGAAPAADDSDAQPPSGTPTTQISAGSPPASSPAQPAPPSQAGGVPDSPSTDPTEAEAQREMAAAGITPATAPTPSPSGPIAGATPTAQTPAPDAWTNFKFSDDPALAARQKSAIDEYRQEQPAIQATLQSVNAIGTAADVMSNPANEVGPDGKPLPPPPPPPPPPPAPVPGGTIPPNPLASQPTGTVQDAIDRFDKATGTGVGQAITSVGRIAQDLDQSKANPSYWLNNLSDSLLGTHTLEKEAQGDQQVIDKGKTVETNAQDYITDPTKDKSILARGASFAGSMAPFIAAGPAAPIMGALSMKESGREAAKDKGASDTSAEVASTAIGVVGGGAMALLGPTAGKLLNRVVGGAASGTFSKLILTPLLKAPGASDTLPKAAYNFVLGSAQKGFRTAADLAVLNGATSAISNWAGAASGGDPSKQTNSVSAAFDNFTDNVLFGSFLHAPEMAATEGNNALVNQAVKTEGAKAQFIRQTANTFGAIDASPNLTPAQRADAKDQALHFLSPDVKATVLAHVNNVADAQAQMGQVITGARKTLAGLQPADGNVARMSDQELQSRLADPTQLEDHQATPEYLGKLQAEAARRQQIQQVQADAQGKLSGIAADLDGATSATQELAKQPGGTEALRGLNAYNATLDPSAPRADARDLQAASDLSPLVDPTKTVQPGAEHYLPVTQQIGALPDPDAQAAVTAAFKAVNGRSLTDDERALVVGDPAKGVPPQVLDSNTQQPFVKPGPAKGSLILTDAGIARIRQLVPSAADVLPRSEQSQLEAQSGGKNARKTGQDRGVSDAPPNGAFDTGSSGMTPTPPPLPNPKFTNVTDETLGVRRDSLAAVKAAAEQRGARFAPSGQAALDEINAEIARRQSASVATTPRAAPGAKAGAKAGAEIDYSYPGADGKPVASRGEVTEVHPNHYRLVDVNDGTERAVPIAHEVEQTVPAAPEAEKPAPVAGEPSAAGSGGDAAPDRAAGGTEAEGSLPGIAPESITPELKGTADLVGRLYQKFKAVADRLGVKEFSAATHGGGIGLAVDPNDLTKIQLDLPRLAKQLAKLSPDAAAARLEEVLDEELEHVALDRAAGEGADGHSRERADAAFARVWLKASKEQRATAIKLYDQGASSFFLDGERPSTGVLDTASDAIRGRELMRMISQLQRRGRTSEAVELMTPETKPLFQKLIDYLRKVLPLKDPAAQRMLARAEQLRNLHPDDSADGENASKSQRADVALANGDSLPAKYELAELGDLQASHRNGAPNPDYPAGLNERDYSLPQEREKNEAMASQFDPRRVLTDNPDAVNGPPIVDQNGLVLGGNRRTIALGDPRAYGRYRPALEQQASRFGVDPEQVRSMKQPVLVRRVQATPEQRPELIRRLNETPTGGIDRANDAVSAGKQLSPDLVRTVGDLFQSDPDKTPLQHLTDGDTKSLAQGLLDAGAIRPNDREKYVAPNGNLTPEGARFARTVLLGGVVPDAQLLRSVEGTPTETKLLNGLSPLYTARSRGVDLTPLTEAVRLEADRQRNGIKTVQDHQAQGALDGIGAEGSEPAKNVQTILGNISARDARRALTSLQGIVAPLEPGQTGLFGETNRKSIGDISPGEALQVVRTSKSIGKAARGLGEAVAGAEVHLDQTLTPDNEAVKRGILPPGTYSQAKFHEALISHFLSKAEPVTGRKPEVVLLGGGGGAGKTSILKKLQAEGKIRSSGHVEVNADEFKTLLPEYEAKVKAGDRAAARDVHHESAFLARELAARAMQDKRDLIIDGTMKSKESGLQLIRRMKDAGYKIDFVGVTADPAEAIRRAEERGDKTGRFVPTEDLARAHSGFNEALPSYLRALQDGGHTARVFDNSGATPQELPVEEIRNETYTPISERARYTHPAESPRGSEVAGVLHSGDDRGAPGGGEEGGQEADPADRRGASLDDDQRLRPGPGRPLRGPGLDSTAHGAAIPDLFERPATDKPQTRPDEAPLTRTQALNVYRKLSPLRADGTIKPAQSAALERAEKALGQSFIPGTEQAGGQKPSREEAASEENSPKLQSRPGDVQQSMFDTGRDQDRGQQLLFAAAVQKPLAKYMDALEQRQAALPEPVENRLNFADEYRTDFGTLPSPALEALARPFARDAGGTGENPEATPHGRFHAHLDLADRMARKFHNVPGVEPDDVRQEARLALYNAAQDHDPAVGTPFRNQAAHYIRNSLIDRYRSQSRRAVEQPTLDEPVGRDRDGLQTTGKDLVRDGSPVPGEATAQADSHDILRSAVSSLPSHLHDVMNDLLAGKSQAEIARDRGVSAQRINAQAKVGLDKLREHFTKQGIGARDLIGGAEVHTPDESELPGAELIKPEDVTIDHDGSTWTEAKDNYDPDDAATWPFANADEIDTYKQAVDGFDKDDPDTWDDFLPAELAGEHGNITDAADEADSLASTLEAQEGISPAVREAARKLEQSIRDQVKDTVLPVAERNYNYAKRVVDDAQAKADAYFADSNDPDVQMSRRDIDEPDTWPKEWSDEYDAAQKQAGLADDDYGPARKMINDVFDAKHGPEIEAAKERVAAKNTEASKASGESQGTLYGAAVDDPPTIGKRLFGDNAFLRDDVAPTVQAIAETFTSAGDSLMKTYAPALRGLEAKHTANILRQNLTEIARNRDHAEAALRKARTFFEGRPVQDNLDFIHAIETNGGIKDPALNEIAQTMRRINNARRDAVRALPTGVFKSFIENYFPHIWKGGEVEDSEAARKFLKKIESSRAFLKHRTIPTIQDGIARGLTPVSFNPVDLFLMRWGQMDRFVAGQKTLGMLKDMGIAQHFPNEEDAPLGWTRIDKRIGLSEEEVPVKTEGDQIPGLEQPPKTVRKKVPYYAPTQAAQVLNNHLSPGLRDKAWYRGIVGAGNALNQAQLGFSAFHLGFTSVDAATSKLAYGLEELAAGRPAHALKAFAQAPLQLGSVFHLLAGRISPSLDTVGGKMHREWMNPGSQSPEIQRLVESVIKAGGRVQQDPLYNNRAWEGFKGAMRRGNYLGGALRAPFALVERASAPIMEYVVPRQKLSVFADMARMGMERLGPGASDEQVRDVMAKAWDSVDNRMGQVVYDNLFWNKVAKDLALASVRSVGWNLGTFRELGGGAVDWGKAGVAAAMMKRPEFTHRMAYTMALPLLTGTIGALVQYLYTGQAPQEPRDYFFPKTGEKDETGHNVRLALPSYMKDVYGFQHDPVHTLTSKIHPMFSAVAQMLQNKDYYGTEISHPGDPLWQRILDEGGFAAKQFLPFSITGQQKMQKSGQSLAKQLLPFVGVTPAPGYVDQSPAEEMAAKFAADRAPTGSQTKQAFDQRQARNLLLNQISKGDNSGIPAAVKAGTVKPGEIAGLLREARQSPLERRFTHLTAEEGAKVFEVATPTEKAILKPMLLRKIQVAAQRGTLPDKRLLKEIASTN